jgi:hypothetical protein
MNNFSAGAVALGLYNKEIPLKGLQALRYSDLVAPKSIAEIWKEGQRT